jgi:uncharacterized protein (DUF433 family)
MDEDLTPEDRIIAAYAAGDTVESITSRYGVGRAQIEALVAGAAPSAAGPHQSPVIPGHDPAPAEVLSTDADLTPEDRIIAAYAAGDTVESITSRYGVGRAEIEALVAGVAPPSAGSYQSPVVARYDAALAEFVSPVQPARKKRR